MVVLSPSKGSRIAAESVAVLLSSDEVGLADEPWWRAAPRGCSPDERAARRPGPAARGRPLERRTQTAPERQPLRALRRRSPPRPPHVGAPLL